PNAQLVRISVDAGKYSFDFSRLDRFVALCRSCGVRAYEIGHLFTQWGAAHAPNVYAIVDGTERRIFGFDTDALSGEYPAFLSRLLPALTRRLSELGIADSCFFHISDEPNASCIDNYRKAKAIVAPYLKDFPIMDALSEVEFYTSGICSHPVTATTSAHSFIDAGVPDLWVYYCCGQHTAVSNRFIAMPSVRNRCIAPQLFKYRIKGFLQWGFIFFFNMGSRDLLNPYLDGSGGLQVPAGDAFQIYPTPEGTPLESIRLVVFHEGLQDLSAFSLCASLYGRDRTVAELESVLGEIRFDKCPSSAQVLLDARARINRLIADRLNN
ncbi:MAG: DUF4091 domain-containing protein, partial [Clostridia bacterium]|nr:DUF4091 domain-containing protein [Clostridia bacterium]